jgi:uncharacterized protein
MSDLPNASPDCALPPEAGASVEEKLAALSMPSTYGPGVHEVRLIETHFAWIFLTQDTVYKLKKPIVARHLDLDTPAKRRENCHEELRLNRALSPEVYLGVESLVRGPEGRLHLDGEGAAVDWLVRMRRLPGNLMLDCAIAAGRVPREQLDAAAHLLIDFYRRQPPIGIAPDAYVQRLQQQIDTNQTELLAVDLGLDPAVVDRLIAQQRATLTKLHAEVAQRAVQRRIIEVHGDLRPEHVCLTSPPAIIDRLEFSLDLRVLDPCEELAYFAIECSHAGAAWVGDRVFSLYRTATADPVPDPLYRLYQSHRAATRAKIVAWHLRDPAFKARQPWSAIAGRYLGEALEYIETQPAT